MTNAFEQAAAQAAPQAIDTNGNLTASYADEQSQLFSGPLLAPSLLNKTHGMGTVRTGKITKAPYDVQARDFNSKAPKFYLATPAINPATGKMSKVGTAPVDPGTGKPNNPVKDTVIELQTGYRFDQAEATAVGRDTNMEDSGTRAFYASGDDLKAIRAEIGRLKFTSGEDMVGATFTVTRIGQKPNPGGNASWINKIEISR